MQTPSENVFEKFFYEISSYLVPGSLLISYYIYFHVGKTEYHSMSWVLFIVLAYVSGLLISAFSFTLFVSSRRGFKILSSSWGYGLLLGNNNISDRKFVDSFLRYDYSRYLYKMNDFLVSELSKDLGIGEDEFRSDLSNVLDTIESFIKCYLNDKRNDQLNTVRYYERICLARNTAIVLFLIIIMNLSVNTSYNTMSLDFLMEEIALIVGCIFCFAMHGCNLFGGLKIT